MKLLPDNPSLDHLRQQAKDLLAGLRDENPDVTLAAAQRSLAQQYGFPGWPVLKAEVDRRRNDAVIASRRLAQEVADRFGLGGVTAGMRSLTRTDHLGRPWVLETERGRWVARSTENWIPIVDVETEVALQDAALAAGIQLPHRYAASTGTSLRRSTASVGGSMCGATPGRRWSRRSARWSPARSGRSSRHCTG